MNWAQLSHLRWPLEYGPPDFDVYNYLSRIYLTNDRSAEAVPVLEEAVSHFPDNSELQANLLNAYTMSGEMDRAIEQYSSAVADNPDNNLYRYNYGSLPASGGPVRRGNRPLERSR